MVCLVFRDCHGVFFLCVVKLAVACILGFKRHS